MDTLKLIKSLNERMAVYERKGLTASATYKELQASLDLLDIEKVQVKGGGFRISRSKANIAALSTDDGKSKLARVERIGGLKKEKARAKNSLKKEGIKKPTERMINERITNYGRLKEWADNNLEFLYEMEWTLDSAAVLTDLFDNGIRKNDYSVIFGAIEAFEEEAAKWEEKAKSGDLKNGTTTPILSGKYQKL